MAVFNPTINPTNDPSYRESRAIDVPEEIRPRGQEANTILPTGIRHIDESGKYAYEGEGRSRASLGGLIESGAKLGSLLASEADAIVTTKLTNEIYSRLDPERDLVTRQLQSMTASGKGGYAGGDLISDNTGDIPKDVVDVEGKLGSIVGAKNAGKIPLLEYTTRTAAILKDVRDRWPGYRDHIDSVGSRLLGGDPANMRIRQLVQLANEQSASSNAQHNKDVSFATQHIGLISPAVFDAVRKGVPGAADKMYRQAGPLIAEKQWLEVEDATRARITHSRQFTEDNAIRTQQGWIGLQVATHFSTLVPEGGVESAKQVSDYVNKVHRGRIQEPPEKVQAAVEMLTALRDQAKSTILSEANTPQKNGKTRIQEMGVDGNKKFNEALDQAMYIYNHAIDSAKEGAVGAIAMTANHTKALIAKSANNALTDATIGKYFLQLSGIGALGGPAGFGREIAELALKDNVTYHLKAYSNSELWDRVIDNGKTKGFNTITDSINKATNGGITEPQVFKDILGDTKQLFESPNSPPKAKVNLLNNIYSKKFVDKIEADRIDPVTGRTIPGKYSVFDMFTSKKMVAEAKKLQETYPEERPVEKLRDWAGSEFSTLLGNELRDMKDLQALGILKYNSDTHQLETKSQSPYVRRRVNSLNYGIRSLINVAEATGKDVDVQILETLVALGYNPNEKTTPAADQWKKLFGETFPDAIWKAITYSRQKSVLER